MIPGKATFEATSDLAQNHPDLTFRPLVAGGPLVSQAGFGGYRVAQGVEMHQQALAHALNQGINLIDTSSNYSDGQSESLISQVIAAGIGSGALRREAITIISKGGYIQGANQQLLRQRKAAGNPFANVVNYADGLDHCIHPEFLADQLSRSLDRLGMDCIDGYLLHNPEYYLMWAHKWHRPLAESRESYYQRIRLAFQHLEEEAARGRIQYYGISSNSFPAPADDPTFTSLETVWQIAESISNQHHFRIIQLPMNLLETGGAAERNQSEDRSVLTFARQKGLAVLINRPLNALHGDSLTRLAEMLPPSYPTTPIEVSTLVDRLVEQELAFQQEFLPILALPAVEHRPLLEQLSLGRILSGQWRGLGSYQNWQDLQHRFLLPRAQQALKTLSNLPNLPAELLDWSDRYVEAVNTAFAAVGAFYQEESGKQAEAIKKRVSGADPEWDGGSLSQIALRALRSTSGVTSVLTGMRRTAYVNDVLAELSRPIEQKDRDDAWLKLRRLATAAD